MANPGQPLIRLFLRLPYSGRLHVDNQQLAKRQPLKIVSKAIISLAERKGFGTIFPVCDIVGSSQS
jgi:hypothetical protein